MAWNWKKKTIHDSNLPLIITMTMSCRQLWHERWKGNRQKNYLMWFMWLFSYLSVQFSFLFHLTKWCNSQFSTKSSLGQADISFQLSWKPTIYVMQYGTAHPVYDIQGAVTHMGLKFQEISFVHNIHFSCQIILKICTEDGSDTAVLCTKFQNDLTNEK